MAFFEVDKEKCVQDGFCSEVCPIEIIEIKDGYPQMKRMAHLICIGCGHCVSVCPKNAIEIKGIKKGECLELESFSLNPEDTEKFLRQRRSIRRYKDKKVDKNLIEKIIDIARYAPSGHNTQPLNWMVVYDTEKVQEAALKVIEWMKLLKEKDPQTAKHLQADMIINGWEKDGKDFICRNAPHLIICHSDKNLGTAPIAGYTATAYVELAAPSFGIGTCWAGYLNMALNDFSPLKEILSIPESHNTYGTIMLGYPKFKYKRAPSRRAKEIKWL